MITSKAAQTADSSNFVHGCFMVRVGSDFNTYQEIMKYAMQDELHGTKAKPGLESNVKTVLDSGGGLKDPLPVYFSKRKARDSSLGGNDAINPLPQFSLDDDIGHPHLGVMSGVSLGMGQVYSENYDDNQQVLYMGFGIPVFSNVGNFWTSAVDADMAGFVNKGTGITKEKVGYLLGSAPLRIIKIATIPFKYVAAMVNGLQEVPITKYYSFSSQMPMYFRFVNTILVMLATNMSIMGSDDELSTTGSDVSGKTAIGLTNEGTRSTQDLSGMGSVFKDYGLDMARIMTKRYLYENGYQGSMKNRDTDYGMITAAALNDGEGVAQKVDPNQSTNATADGGAASVDTSQRKWTLGWFDAFAAAYTDTIYDGHLFIGFRIDKGMGASESFSNSTGESQIAQVANSKFQQSRDAKFAAMNGNFGDGGLMDAIKGAVSALGSVVSGAVDSFNLDPLAAAISGAAKIDIPEVWMNSNYSRSQSFSITCLSPYGDLESVFQSEYVPLACLLAGTLPRGTGQASHSSPFICQAYCRGIFSSPLCMIESMEVTRGADQFGFNSARLPLKLSIRVTLKDLSPVMYMDLGGDTGIAKQIFGSDSNFGEYMLTLSGMGLRERLAPFRNMRRKTRILLSTLYKNKLSPFMLGMEGGSRFTISRLISTVVSGGRGLPGN